MTQDTNTQGQAPAGAGMGHTDGGRNMFYEGRFDGESQREQQARLRWANDMRAAFERHTGNGWFDKDWRTETGLWSSAWHACLAAQPSPTAQAGEPFGYFHQLLNHEGKGNGVWLGAAERKVVEQAHTPGETSEEIVALYTTPQPTQAQATEPVAWLDPWTGTKVTTDYDAYGKHGIPLYTAPQPVAREPLTDEQIKALMQAHRTAMLMTCKARVPECGEFAAIAQDLDWLCESLGIKGGQHEPKQID